MTPQANPSIRFLLFRATCDDCNTYPGELEGAFATLAEAKANAKVYHSTWSGWWSYDTIYDTWTGEYPSELPEATNDSQSNN